ncbi:hypothetical protein OG508_28050 [Streptomyces sp. NBC_01108]|uniref:hypothetical protein n=1 Tax=Streptomyces sp. NBC_01108 TaxID=2903751 RepID=UPI003873805E|nr:hypothetical protein OG508_28050 [Streptomyces sp. NBC_01108]
MSDPHLTGRVDLDLSRLIEGLRFARAVTNRQISRLVRDANQRLRGVDTNSLTSRLSKVGTKIGQGFGAALGPLVSLKGAVVLMLPQIAALAVSLAQIAPAAALAVSGVLAIGLAAGTLKIAMSGVGDAVTAALDPSDPEAYAEALKKLTPNARAFVEQIHKAQPAFDAIKKTVQDRVFAGLDKQLSSTAKVALPELRTALSSTAGTLNQMATGVFTAVRGLAKDGALGVALKSATQGLREFRRVPGQVVTGLVQIGAAAAPAFERVSKAGGSAMDRLSVKIDKALKSGGMESAINGAIDLLGQLGRVIGNVSAIFGNLIKGLSQGNGLFGTLEKITGALKDATATPGFQRALQALSQTMGVLTSTVAPLLAQALGVLGPVIEALAGPTQQLVRALGDALGKILKSLGPVLVQLADSFGTLVVALLPIITLFGDLIANLLPALTPLFKALGDVFVELTPLIAQLAKNIGAQLQPLLQALPEILNTLLPPFVELIGAVLPPLVEILALLTPGLADLSRGFAELFVALAPLIAEVLNLGVALAQELAPTIVPLLLPAIKLFTLAMKAFAFSVTDFVAPALRAVIMVLKGDFKGAADLALATARNLDAKVSEAFGNLVQKVRLRLGEFVIALQQKVKDGALQFTQGVNRMASDAVAKVRDLPNRIRGALGNLGSLLYSAGANIIQGLIDGIRSNIPSVQGVLSGLTNMIPEWKGPRRKDATLLTPAGRLIMQGLIKGITATTPALRSSLKAVTADLKRFTSQSLLKGLTGSTKEMNAAIKSLQSKLAAAFGTDMQRVIDAGNSKLASLAQRRAALVKRLGATRSSSGRRDLQRQITAIDKQAAGIRREIATAAGVQKSGAALQRVVDAQTRHLAKLAAARDAVVKKLEAAQTKLADLKKARSAAAESITSGILADANITSGNNVVNSVSAITVGLQLAVKKTKDFAANLAKLKKAGLRSDLLGDIANAGVDGGAATAQALARATPAELKRINDLQAQLAKAATTTSTSVAGALYDAGVKAAQGLVDGLKKQQGAIEKQMEKIATAMVKAMKKALKIKSPSRVFMGIGELSGDGLREGMLRSRAAVAAASASMAAAAVGAADVAGLAMRTIPAPGQLTAAYAGTAGAPTTNNTFNLYQSDATPDGILRALSWQGLIGRKG